MLFAKAATLPNEVLYLVVCTNERLSSMCVLNCVETAQSPVEVHQLAFMRILGLHELVNYSSASVGVVG